MIPILGEVTPGTTQRHLIKLPGAALLNDEPRPVISVAGAKPGPVLFVNAGVHGGDIPEALVPFVICRAGNDEVAKKSKAIATAFGLPYVLTVSKPVQPAKGQSSYAAAAEKGVPSILAEAGEVGQLQ